MEGGYLSNAAVERSKQRLQRLPFIEKVEVETNPVPGTPDLVDVDFDIKEGLPGQFSGGIGYSESQSFILNGSFVHSNFMGTGNRVAAEINAGQYSKVFSLSHTDPYTTIDGVSRTVSATYREHRPVHVGVVGLRDGDRHARGSTTAGRSPSSSRCAWDSRRSARTCSPIRTRARTRRSTGCRTTATRTPKSTQRRRSRRSRFDLLRHQVRHVRARRWAGLTIRATARSSPTAAARHRLSLELHAAGQRRRVLHAQLRLPAVHPDRPLVHGHV